MTRQTPDRAANTAAVMRDTAAELEAVEEVLHRSAEESPDPEAADRLHRLGDEVTARAKDIARRADDL